MYISETGSNGENIDIGQLVKDLLLQWLNKKDFLSGKEKSTLFEIGCNHINNTDALYKLNKAVINRQEILSDEVKGLKLKVDEGVITLMSGDKLIEFTEIQLKEVLTGMIDILEKILPLGTVVDLEKRYLSSNLNIEKIGDIRIVITHRFLYQEDDTAYFQYAGTVYPIGMFDGSKSIYFTPAMIEKVVHTGYSDIQDDAYIYMMKQELILEKGMHSYGFSTEDERISLKKKIEIKEGISNDRHQD